MKIVIKQENENEWFKLRVTNENELILTFKFQDIDENSKSLKIQAYHPECKDSCCCLGCSHTENKSEFEKTLDEMKAKSKRAENKLFTYEKELRAYTETVHSMLDQQQLFSDEIEKLQKRLRYKQ